MLIFVYKEKEPTFMYLNVDHVYMVIGVY